MHSPTKCSLLQLLTPVQRITKLQQPDIVLGDGIDEMTCGVELTKSELVVVFVVENVEKGGKERMEVLVWSGGR
jgi:hypothetical protein